MSPTTPCSTQCPPGRHKFPFSPTQAHRLRGPWSPGLGGERQFTSKVPTGECRPLGQGSCSLHSNASMPERALGSQVLCAHPSLKQILGPPRVEELPRETGSVPTSVCMPQASAENKDTSHLPGSQRAERGEEGPGLALTEDERLNVRLRRRRRLCFLRLLRWLR